jgi:hypothetical protein
VIVAVPGVTPVTTSPDTVATDVLLLLQLKEPDVVSFKVVVPPTHVVSIPVIAEGSGFTFIG